MPAQPLTRRARWTGGACALAALARRTSSILAARSSARRPRTSFDLTLLHDDYAGLAALTIALRRRHALARAERAAWRAVA